MWSKNEFGDNENNVNQADYPLSAFGNLPGQPYFPQLPIKPNMMQSEGGNGEGFMNGEFQPDVGFYTEGTFAQNQFVNAANAQVSSSYLPPAVFCEFVRYPNSASKPNKSC